MASHAARKILGYISPESVNQSYELLDSGCNLYRVGHWLLRLRRHGSGVGTSSRLQKETVAPDYLARGVGPGGPRGAAGGSGGYQRRSEPGQRRAPRLLLRRREHPAAPPQRHGSTVGAIAGYHLHTRAHGE